MTAKWWSRVRSIIDARLHPARHQRAAERLAGGIRPRTILVVCHANICRSPYLAAVLEQLLPDVQVRSAGFVSAGRPAPEHAQAIAIREGLDLAGHRSHLLAPGLARQADLVIVMDSRQAWQVRQRGAAAERIYIAGDLDPFPSDSRAIRDPWGRPFEAYEASFARLRRCATGLSALLSGPPGARY